jgi:hypothetical protein
MTIEILIQKKVNQNVTVTVLVLCRSNSCTVLYLYKVQYQHLRITENGSYSLLARVGPALSETTHHQETAKLLLSDDAKVHHIIHPSL